MGILLLRFLEIFITMPLVQKMLRIISKIFGPHYQNHNGDPTVCWGSTDWPETHPTEKNTMNTCPSTRRIQRWWQLDGGLDQ